MKTNLFRQIGVLYLLVIICAGTSQGYIRELLIISDNPAATAEKIIANASLFRFGITLDLIAFVIDVVISILLYEVFKGYDKTLALISAAFRLIAHPAIGSLNLLNHYYGYHLITGSNMGLQQDSNQWNELGMSFLEGHSFGYLIAGVFFGIHCFLLGYLIYKSKYIPKPIGVLMIIAGFGYLIESFGNFNFPNYETYTALLVGVTAAVGELTLTIYFLITSKKFNKNHS